MPTENNLEHLRRAAHLTHEQLAAQIASNYSNHENISTRTIRRWETNSAAIPERYWARLSEIFGVSIAHVLGLDRPDSNGGNGSKAVAA